MSEIIVPKLSCYDKTVVCPPDKSVSVRAVLLCAYAIGQSTVKNLSLCGDVLSAVDCVTRLGATVELDGSTAHIFGAPFRSCELDCGNSATAARLLMGLLAPLNGEFTITGDESLCRRPMRRVIDPLEIMGARISSTNGHLPVKIIGTPLGGIHYHMPICSAQVKSALLLAGLNAAGTVTVTEKIKTRDHTEIMLNSMNGNIRVDGDTVSMKSGMIVGTEFTVPGDVSAAAYPVILSLCMGGGCVVKNVGLNPTRTALFTLLRKMGAHIAVDNETSGAEPRGDITVGSGRLRPFVIGEAEASCLIDELPALCALGCFIDGISVIDGANELRNKESDRIHTTVAALRGLGAEIEETENGIIIYGGKPLKYGIVDPCGDHRIAMAAAIAGAAGGGATIKDGECVKVSYPAFFEEVIGV